MEKTLKERVKYLEDYIVALFDSDKEQKETVEKINQSLIFIQGILQKTDGSKMHKRILEEKPYYIG